MPNVPTPLASNAKSISYQYDQGNHSKPRPTLVGFARMWPTPTKSDGTGGPGNSGREGGENLRTAVQTWPSPAARDWRSGKGRTENGHTPQLPERVGGQLNPRWVAWLMGWSIEATKLGYSEMVKFRSARRLLGKSSGARE